MVTGFSFGMKRTYSLRLPFECSRTSQLSTFMPLMASCNFFAFMLMFLSVDLLIDNFNLECAGDLKPYAKVADAHPIAAEGRLVLLDEQLVH